MKALGIDLQSENPIKFQFDDADIDDGIRRDITVVSHMRESHEMIIANMIRIRRHLPAGLCILNYCTIALALSGNVNL